VTPGWTPSARKNPNISAVLRPIAAHRLVGNNHLAARDGYKDDAESAAQYVQFLNGDDDNYDHRLRRALNEGSIEAIRYYTDHIGIPFSVIGRQDQYYPDAPGSVAGGRSLEVAMPARNWATGGPACAHRAVPLRAHPARDHEKAASTVPTATCATSTTSACARISSVPGRDSPAAS